MDYFQTLGCLSLGSRLKRLSDRLYKDVAVIYQEQNIELHPTYFPLFHLLHQEGSLSITQAAEMLNVSHPAISKIANKMQAEGIISKAPDPNDDRRNFLTLNHKSLGLLDKINPVLNEMRLHLDSIINTQRHPILASLAEFEKRYNQEGLVEPVLSALTANVKHQKVEISPWQAQYKSEFHRLNMAWLTKYFSEQINELDQKALKFPESFYLATGGYIWFATCDSNITGCIALANHQNGCYEISKMAVDEDHQGFGIGRKLLLTALNKARELQATTIYLETSSLLPRALTLYHNMGFTQKPHPKGASDYGRADIYMELIM